MLTTMLSTFGAPERTPRPGAVNAGDGVFEFAVVGAIGGIILGGVVGLVTNNTGLKAIDDPAFFLIAVGFAAVGVGMIPGMVLDEVIAALTRGSSTAIGGGSMFVLTILASGAAAMLFMLVAQSLAVPVALVILVASSAWLAIVLIRVGIKSTRARP